jgi:hypothetical protein
MDKFPPAIRKRLFDFLSDHSSSEFVEYLRAFESLPKSSNESFEVSCELMNGKRIDQMRLAILGLNRNDVLGWVSACRLQIPLIEELLFENTKDECFGIGLADYPSGAGLCRIKLYNEYRDFQSQTRTIAHIQTLFSLLNIPDEAFKKDLELFGKVRISAIDWDMENQAMIKVYFGFFRPEGAFQGFAGALLKEDLICYNNYKKHGFMPEKVQFSIRYSKEERSLKTEMFFQGIKIVPFLKLFDHQREVSRFFADFYKDLPDLVLHVISMQWVPVERMQFYFMIRPNLRRMLD